MKKFKMFVKMICITGLASIAIFTSQQSCSAAGITVETNFYYGSPLFFWNYGGTEILCAANFGETGHPSMNWMYFRQDGTTEAAHNFKAAGNISALNYSCTSDYRYKKDILPLTNSFDKLCALNGVYYNWKKDEFKDKNFSDKHQIGFIAQDVEKIFPELVFTDSDGYKSMSYDKMSVVIVEAMKEMKIKNDAKISSLEKENAILKDKVASLEKMSERLAKLEAMMSNNRIAQK